MELFLYVNTVHISCILYNGTHDVDIIILKFLIAILSRSTQHYTRTDICCQILPEKGQCHEISPLFVAYVSKPGVDCGLLIHQLNYFRILFRGKNCLCKNLCGAISRDYLIITDKKV